MLGPCRSKESSSGGSRADSDAYLTAFGVGLLAGLVVTYARTPLHMPGHKVLFWMVPALACRLIGRARAGATISVLGTICTTLLMGGQLGGGWVMMPLVLVGFTLDVTADTVERHKVSAMGAAFVDGSGGAGGNLICFIKRLLVR